MEFGEDTLVVNRTIRPLDFMFDGRPGVLKPGYKAVEKEEKGTAKLVVVPAGRDGQPVVNHLPFQMAEMARRQNIIKGTEDPFDIHNVQYLVGVAVRNEDTGALVPAENWPMNAIDPCEQSDALERLDRSKIEKWQGRDAEVVPAFGFPRDRGAAAGGEPFKAGPDAHFGILESGR